MKLPWMEPPEIHIVGLGFDVYSFAGRLSMRPHQAGPFVSAEIGTRGRFRD